MRLAAFRGFLIDLALSGVAGVAGWHPLRDWLAAHPSFVYWAGGGLHIALIPSLILLTMFGSTRTADFLTQNRTSGHERAFVWSMVGTYGTSFIVPFACALMLQSDTSLAFSMATVFAPAAGFLGPMFWVLLFPKTAQRDIKLPNPFASSVGRAVVAIVMALYLVLQEATLFMCSASPQRVSGLLTALGFFLSYVPIRLFLFYTTASDRRELASLVASLAFVGVQLM
jgi:hypothetical protein